MELFVGLALEVDFDGKYIHGEIDLRRRRRNYVQNTARLKILHGWLSLVYTVNGLERT